MFMYVLAYIGSGLLLRYAEGATFLAIVQVSNFKHFMCTTFAKKKLYIHTLQKKFGYFNQSVGSLQKINH